MAVNQIKGDKFKKNISIMTVLANCKTGDSRRLLEEYKIPKAINHEDLEYKLAKLYKESDDKTALEKKIAELHPHKDFILKYCAPKVVEEKQPIVEEKKQPIDLQNDTVVKAEKIIVEPSSNFSSACGCSSCQQSSFDGAKAPQVQTPSKSMDNDKIVILGMFGLVTMITLVLITKK